MLTGRRRRPRAGASLRRWSRRAALQGIIAAILATAPGISSAAADCHAGAYRLSDGRLLDIAPSEGRTLRWRTFDGETGALQPRSNGARRSTYGWTGRPDGKTVTFRDCAAGRLRFNGVDGRRIPLKVSDTTFKSDATKLAGRLVLPPGRGPVAIVVLVHGAEHDSAIEDYFLQRMLPAQGVGVFVYNKRGAGSSGGRYTQDFQLLAKDAVAAMREARRLAGPRAGRIGYQGGSQGGWVAPLAAARAPVDFVIVSFGLAVSVLDEDQETIALQMRLKGYGPEVIAKAQEIGQAAGVLFGNGFTSGFERFEALRAKYRNEPGTRTSTATSPTSSSR